MSEPSAMQVQIAPYSPDAVRQSLYWIEPELPHSKVIVVVSEVGVVYHSADSHGVRDWGVMLNPIKQQFRQLAAELHMASDSTKWRTAAFFCYIVPLDLGGEPPHFAIRFALPLLSLVFPRDNVQQGIRALSLHQAFSDQAYPGLRLVPHTFIGLPATDRELHSQVPDGYRRWAETWGVDSILVLARDKPYTHAPGDHLMRYTPGLRRMFGWDCKVCEMDARDDEFWHRQAIVDHNLGRPTPVCPTCGTASTFYDDEDDDL